MRILLPASGRPLLRPKPIHKPKINTELIESEATRDFKNENKREFASLMFINPFLTNTAEYLTHLTYHYCRIQYFLSFRRVITPHTRFPAAKFDQNNDILTFLILKSRLANVAHPLIELNNVTQATIHQTHEQWRYT